MWQKSENGDATRPKAIEKSRGHYIMRRNFRLVPADDDKPEHYEFEEWQMPKEQYDVYKNFEQLVNDQSDALVELAELFAMQDDALVELASMLGEV